jgi:hypothetical protein
LFLFEMADCCADADVLPSSRDFFCSNAAVEENSPGRLLSLIGILSIELIGLIG